LLTEAIFLSNSNALSESGCDFNTVISTTSPGEAIPPLVSSYHFLVWSCRLEDSGERVDEEGDERGDEEE